MLMAPFPYMKTSITLIRYRSLHHYVLMTHCIEIPLTMWPVA